MSQDKLNQEGNFKKNKPEISDNENTPIRLDAIKRSISNNSIGAVILLVVGILIGAGQLTEAINKLLVAGGFKPDALMLANEDAKGELTRRLIELGYKRIFWIQNYVARYKRIKIGGDSLMESREKSPNLISSMADESDIDLAWNEYIKTVEGWSMNLVINEQLINRYHSDEKSETFDGIHNSFRDIHADLVTMRYNNLGRPVADSILVEIKTKTDVLNTEILFFVTGLEEDRRK